MSICQTERPLPVDRLSCATDRHGRTPAAEASSAADLPLAGADRALSGRGRSGFRGRLRHALRADQRWPVRTISNRRRSPS